MLSLHECTTFVCVQGAMAVVSVDDTRSTSGVLAVLPAWHCTDNQLLASAGAVVVSLKERTFAYVYATELKPIHDHAD